MDQITEAWKHFGAADYFAIMRNCCRPNSDAWYYNAAQAYAYERKGLRLLAKALGIV